MSVEHRKLVQPAGTATVNISRFRGAGGVSEWHITVVPEAADTFDEHLGQVASGYQAAMAAAGLDAASAVWRRFFCSDIANQASVLGQHAMASGGGDSACAVSVVGQTPLASAKLALWACHIVDPRGPLAKTHDGRTLALQRGSLCHLWTTGMDCVEEATVPAQTQGVFDGYVAGLAARGLTLFDHVVRTWLFQPYIDLDYHGMVTARREFFAAQGLTADSHYIASTGIAGKHALPPARVFMDAYAVGGLLPGQVEFLRAGDRLGPTSDYGVTFERATAVTYQDRKQVFISGTASIDPAGQIVHAGDVVRQLDRTLGNIAGLLGAAGAGLGDMQVFLVYLRDPSDHARVLPALRERLGDAPMIIVDAAVCRPGWLIEIEGVASIAVDGCGMPPF